jgi:acyl carrier protein
VRNHAGQTAARREIRSRLIRLISEITHIPTAQITEGATLDQELGMESAIFVEVQVAVEDEYDIEIDPLEVLELNEFGAIVDYVYALVLQRG